MQFVDNTTPSNVRQYQLTLENIAGLPFASRRQRANDWAAMYYGNAYNTAMTNYMNEYNSPKEQMLRYMEAGINPFLAGQDSGNMSGAPNATVPKGSPDAGPKFSDIASATLSGLGTLSGALRTAQSIYDYIKYGRDISSTNLRSAQQLLSKYQSEADWSLYWNYGEGMGPNSPAVQSSPRAQYMHDSTQRISAQVRQLTGLVDMIYPSQKEANEARSALTGLQKEILDGQRGAVLNIKTGNETADSILRMVVYWLMDL